MQERLAELAASADAYKQEARRAAEESKVELQRREAVFNGVIQSLRSQLAAEKDDKAGLRTSAKACQAALIGLKSERDELAAQVEDLMKHLDLSSDRSVKDAELQFKKKKKK
jgi:hypothetical protein